MPIADLLIQTIHERGPLTVAAFMDLALYHPEYGYYARASQRSGRAGDFVTSVDVGAIFGELVAVQVAEMARLLGSSSFDLVEAGAGNGRLSADILRALGRRDSDVYVRTRLHLVEASAAARDAHRRTLDDVAERLASSSASLPSSFEGVLFANELLDAMPVHQIVMRSEGLREVYVDAAASRGNDAGLVTHEGPPSTPALAEYLQRLDVAIEPGWRVEINLHALDWIRDAARSLRRGFIVLIDYGHRADELYSVTHSAGTLTTFAGHTMEGPESAHAAPWLKAPGEQDITSHVDFTSVRRAAEAEGLTTLGLLDQTYFLLGLLGSLGSAGSEGSQESPVNPLNLLNPLNLKQRLALKTLVMPGGLGSTLKVLILGKGVGAPPLVGCSYRVRMT